MDEFVLHCLASFAGHRSSVAIKEGQMRRSGSILFHSRQAALQTLLLAFALSPIVLVAQGYFGTVSGELTDATGAVCKARGLSSRISRRDSRSIQLPTA